MSVVYRPVSRRAGVSLRSLLAAPYEAWEPPHGR